MKICGIRIRTGRRFLPKFDITQSNSIKNKLWRYSEDSYINKYIENGGLWKDLMWVTRSMEEPLKGVDGIYD